MEKKGHHLKIHISKRRIAISILLISGIFSLIGISIYKMVNSSTDNRFVNLAIEKNNKTYVYSKLGTIFVESSIKKNESPNLFGFVRLFEKDENLYVSPNELNEIVDLLCGNFILHDYPEKSYDGYVTSGNSSCHRNSFKNQSTQTVGEQVKLNALQITNKSTGEAHNIRWSYNLKKHEYRALENCEEKSFMIRTSVVPGETVWANEDFIVVNLYELANFFGDKVHLEFKEEQQLLYILHK